MHHPQRSKAGRLGARLYLQPSKLLVHSDVVCGPKSPSNGGYWLLIPLCPEGLPAFKECRPRWRTKLNIYMLGNAAQQAPKKSRKSFQSVNPYFVLHRVPRVSTRDEHIPTRERRYSPHRQVRVAAARTEVPGSPQGQRVPERPLFPVPASVAEQEAPLNCSQARTKFHLVSFPVLSQIKPQAPRTASLNVYLGADHIMSSLRRGCRPPLDLWAKTMRVLAASSPRVSKRLPAFQRPHRPAAVCRGLITVITRRESPGGALPSISLSFSLATILPPEPKNFDFS